jgi:putative tryptophan/tyrosine transport system substrate-binding protein
LFGFNGKKQVGRRPMRRDDHVVSAVGCIVTLIRSLLGVPLAATSHLPTRDNGREFVEAGGFLSYGPRRRDTRRHAATYVDQILQGAKPADLPVERPMKFELVITLKTAHALGIIIPPTLRFQADEVIR